MATKRAELVGGRRTKEASAWKCMVERCYLPTNPSFQHYGGRGITVCARWLDDYRHFLDDMGRAPEGTSLDRIDPNGNYEPNNCRWATDLEQQRNRRNTPFITYQGHRMALSEAAEKAGVKYITAWARYSRGWPEDRLFEAASHRRPHSAWVRPAK